MFIFSLRAFHFASFIWQLKRMQKGMRGYSERYHEDVKDEYALDAMVARNNYHMAVKYANPDLELYKNSNKDAEFEVVRALYLEKSGVHRPGLGVQFWRHVVFIAKPKNSDSSDVSSKHFFAELLYNLGYYDVKYCASFEPSDEPGNARIILLLHLFCLIYMFCWILFHIMSLHLIVFEFHGPQTFCYH